MNLALKLKIFFFYSYVGQDEFGNKYYEDKLKYNSPLYMRLVDWNRNTVSTNFNCYCENF